MATRRNANGAGEASVPPAPSASARETLDAFGRETFRPQHGSASRPVAIFLHFRRLDPIDRPSHLVGPINSDGVAALAQAG